MHLYDLSTDGIPKIEKRRSVNVFFVFLFWPLLALVIALRNFQQKESRFIIYLFFIYFGATFCLINPSFDSFRLYEEFRIIASKPFSDFWKIMSGLYTETRADVAKPIVMFTLSRIGSSEALLFSTFAAIFGWFYLKGIYQVYSDNNIRHNINAGIFFLFFIFLNTIFNINGFRFNTAIWVFYYGAYNIVAFRDKRFFVVSILAALFHFSFIFANLVLLAYYFLGNRNKLFSLLFIVSLIMPEFLWPQIQSIADLIGGTIQTKFEVYTNPEYGEKVIEINRNIKWFMILSGKGIFYYVLFLLFYIRNKYENIFAISSLNNLFSFNLFFISMINFVKYIPSMGRFRVVFYLFALSYIIGIFSQLKSSKITFLTWIGIGPFALGLLITIRGGIEMTSLWLFGPLPLAFYAEPFSLYEMISSLF